MDTFWQTYLTREGEQPQAYDAEARALQGQMERRHLSTVELGTVITLPRGNLNDIWSYNDWYVSDWDLYRVHVFTRSGSTALDFIANMDNHTPSQERNGVIHSTGCIGARSRSAIRRSVVQRISSDRIRRSGIWNILRTERIGTAGGLNRPRIRAHR